MDERSQDLLDRVQKAARQMGGAAAGAAQLAGKKTAALLSAGKLGLQARDLEAQTAARLQEVGEMLYATHCGDPAPAGALLEKLEEIDALRARSARIAAQIAQLQGGRACPHCGAPARADDQFCRGCGRRLT